MRPSSPARDARDIVFTAAPALSPALPANAVLSELAAAALAAQPAVVAADAQARADAQRVEQARGALRPNVGASASYRREYASSGAATPYSSTSGGLLLSMPVYRPQARASIGQAESVESSSRYAAAESRRDVLGQLVDAYVGAALADEQADLLEQERNVLLEQRRLNERRMAGGVGTSVEVMETSARAEALLAQVRAARNDARTQLADLSRLVQRPMEQAMHLKPGLPPRVVPATADEALAAARTRNTTIARLEASLAAARANVEVERAGRWPTVDVVGNVDRSHFASGGSIILVPSTAVGVQVAVPVFTGGVLQARIGEAAALEEKAAATLTDGLRQLETDLRKAYIDLDSTTQQWRAQTDALKIANAALDATRQAFNAGIRTNIDLLNSQQLTFTARSEVLRLRIAVLSAQMRILALIEDLSVASLARFDSAFERPSAPPTAVARDSRP